MNASSINTLTPKPKESIAPTRTDLAASQRSFLSVLGKQVEEPAATTAEQRARQVAEQMVSISLVQPMLKQLRSSNNAAPPFAPTEGEKQFRALTDADLAQQIVHAKQFPLVDRLAHIMLERGEKLASGESLRDEISKARTPNRPTTPGVTAIGR